MGRITPNTTFVKHKETGREGAIITRWYNPATGHQLFVVVKTIVGGELVKLHVDEHEMDQWEGFTPLQKEMDEKQVTEALDKLKERIEKRESLKDVSECGVYQDG